MFAIGIKLDELRNTEGLTVRCSAAMMRIMAGIGRKMKYLLLIS